MIPYLSTFIYSSLSFIVIHFIVVIHPKNELSNKKDEYNTIKCTIDWRRLA